MFNKKNGKEMIKLFEQEMSFCEFWKAYERFRIEALRGSGEYQDFANGLVKSGGDNQKTWKKAFKISMGLAAVLSNEDDAERVVTKMIDILERNMSLYSLKDMEEERFIVLDVCIDILAVMCGDDKIHYPAALYDILQKTNDENPNCDRFYGQSAEKEVLRRTYDVLEKMDVLDKWTRYNDHNELYKRNFVNMLALLRYKRSEEQEKRRKMVKVMFAAVVIVLLVCRIYIGYMRSISGLIGQNEEFQKENVQLEEENGKLRRLNASFESDNQEIQAENNGLKDNNRKLEEEIKKLKEEKNQAEKNGQPGGEEAQEGEPADTDTDNMESAEPGIALAIDREVDLYGQPGENEEPIEKLKPEDKIDVLEFMEQKGWLRVRKGETEGYIRYMDILGQE